MVVDQDLTTFKKLSNLYNRHHPHIITMSKVMNDSITDLPKGWENVLVKDVSKKIQYGYTGKALENGEYYYLRITDIQDNNVDWSKTPFVDISKAEATNYQLNKGDIVFARTGATAGKSYLFVDDKISVFASYLIRIITNTQKVIPEFLYNYFQSPKYWSQIFGNIIGAAQPNFNGQKLGEIQIPLPPLPEQQRIVEQLDALFLKIDKAIELTQQNLQHSKHLLPAALNEVFGKAEEKGWKKYKWYEVLTIKNGKDHKKVNNPNGKYPIYGSGGIMGYSDEYLCEEKTTIIGRKGSINSPIYVDAKFWNVDTAFGICAGNKLEPRLLFFFCLSYDFSKHNKSTTLPSLTKTDLLEIEIPLPDLPTQQTIVTYLNQLRNQQQQLITHYTKQLQHLQKLKASLLDAAFGGRL